MKHYDWDNILQYMDEDMLAEALAAGKRAKAGTGSRVYRILLIAAIIASFMVTAAFAAGLLDFRALLLAGVFQDIPHPAPGGAGGDGKRRDSGECPEGHG